MAIRLQESPWASGIGTLAEAIAGIPANRAKARMMDIQATNLAADNARADAQLELSRKTNELAIQRFLFDQANQRTQDVRLDAAESRAAQKFPLETQGLELDNTGKVIQNDFATANNPLLLDEKRAAVQKAQMEAKLEATRIGGLPALQQSLADSVVGNVTQAMPEWSVMNSPSMHQPMNLSGGVLPGQPDPGMEYDMGAPGSMDQLAQREQFLSSLSDRMSALAGSAALSDKTLNQADWIKNQTEQGIAQIPGELGGSGAGSEGPWTGTGSTNDAPRIIADYNLKKQQGIPTTPQEDVNYKIAFDAQWGEKWVEGTDAEGRKVMRPVRSQPPAGIYVPGGAPQQPQMPETGAPVSQAPAGPAPAGPAMPQAPMSQAPMSQAPAGGVPPVSGAPAQPGASRDIVLSGPKPFDPSATQATNMFRAATMAPALKTLMDISGYDATTGRLVNNDKIPGLGQQWVARNGGPFKGMVSPAAQQWDSAVFAAMDPIVRMMTGAALNPSEMPQYLSSWVPQPGMDEGRNRMVLERLLIAHQVFAELAKDPRFANFSQLDNTEGAMAMNQMFNQYLARNAGDPKVMELARAQSEMTSGGAAPAQAPMPAQPAPTQPVQPTVVPSNIDPELWKLLTPEEQTQWTQP